MTKGVEACFIHFHTPRATVLSQLTFLRYQIKFLQNGTWKTFIYTGKWMNGWIDDYEGGLGWEFYEWWCGWVNRTYLAASNVTSNKQGTSLLSTLDIIKVDFLLNVRKCCHGTHKMTNPAAFIKCFFLHYTSNSLSISSHCLLNYCIRPFIFTFNCFAFKIINDIALCSITPILRYSTREGLLPWNKVKRKDAKII